MTTRKVLQSPITQGDDESIKYEFDFTNWGVPSSPVVKMFDSQRLDVSATTLTGSPTVDNNLVITPFVGSLRPGELYRLEVRVLIDGTNTMEAFCEIRGER